MPSSAASQRSSSSAKSGSSNDRALTKQDRSRERSEEDQKSVSSSIASKNDFDNQETWDAALNADEELNDEEGYYCENDPVYESGKDSRQHRRHSGKDANASSRGKPSKAHENSSSARGGNKSKPGYVQVRLPGDRWLMPWKMGFLDRETGDIFEINVATKKKKTIKKGNLRP
ncbi:hypothetical protein VTN49DRAFT_3526 [Thermomyces lanuginosus]|uniref:uncharacterized protein n=1 Tax=Thermomyces lanuginosus TaxID=5541 RepID=UPI003742ECCB